MKILGPEVFVLNDLYLGSFFKLRNKKVIFSSLCFLCTRQQSPWNQGGEGLLGRVRIEVDQGTYIVSTRTFASVNILLLLLKSNINLR